MRKFLSAYGTILFCGIVILDLAGIVFRFEPLHTFAKPLLMPALLLIVLFTTTAFPGKALILTGLFFSFAGDVFLLFDAQYPICFILGLASFLITHVLYIIYFLRLQPMANSLFSKYPALLILILTYVGGLLFLLIPHLGALIVPVIIYAIILAGMLVTSFHVFYRSNLPAARSFVAGAGLFVLSDSLLALNKFYAPLPTAGFLIMLTYCLAQFFIVKGCRIRSL